MLLPGRLAGTTLGDLLGQTFRARLSGVLELEERRPRPGRRHRLVLDAGLVGAVETDAPVTRLGDLLRDAGLLGRVAHDALPGWRRAEPQRRVGELLVDRAGMAPGVVEAALRHQVRQRLDAVFAVEDADVRFHVPGRPAATPSVPLSPREFLHGRPRARAQGGAAGGGPSFAARRGHDQRQPARDPRSPHEEDTAPGPAVAPTGRARALATLGLPRGASAADVKRAFRRLALAHHPDRYASEGAQAVEAARRRFSDLTAAYHALVG